MNRGLRARHLTTVENAAPDMLLLGDEAKQSFAADSWAAGLCLLHLLTGCCPYEELLESVRCPEPLREAIEEAWAAGEEEATMTNSERDNEASSSSSCSYACLRPVLREDEEGVLADTLVRQVVLFGMPTPTNASDNDDGAATTASASRSVPVSLRAEDDAAGVCCDASAPASFAARSPVWAVLLQWLTESDETEDSASGRSRRRNGRGRKARTGTAARGSRSKAETKLQRQKQEAKDWLRRQQALFNVWCGSAPLLQRARRRMAAAPGSAALLWRLCHFDPDRRPGAAEALTRFSAFAPLRDAALAPLPAGVKVLELPGLAALEREDA